MIEEKELKEKNVRHLARDGNLYFYIEDIRKHYPYTKFPAEKIARIEDTAMIMAEDIQEMTEFDKKVFNLMKNKKAP